MGENRHDETAEVGAKGKVQGEGRRVHGHGILHGCGRCVGQ